MKFQFYLFCMLLLVSIVSCFKPNDIDKETAFLPEEFKAYTVFNEGTWWIYEDIHTGERDSSFVFSDTTFIKDSDRISFMYERNEQLTVRRNDTISKEAFPSSRGLEEGYIYIYREGDYPNFSSFMYLLTNPIDSVNQQIPVQGGAFIISMSQTSTIQNQLYSKTITVSFDGAVAENGNPPWRIRSCTFAQNVGMIRIQYYDGTIWELVDYHIAD